MKTLLIIDKSLGLARSHLVKIGGGSAFALMVPVLADYIAFSIADRPGLAPGMVGGMLAVSTGAGFLGGIYRWLPGGLPGESAQRPCQAVAKYVSPEADTDYSAGGYVHHRPHHDLRGRYSGGADPDGIDQWLQSMGTANAVIRGAILGGMMCTDMGGGTVNKVAYVFGTTLLSSHIYAPMAAVMAGGMIPPLAMVFATLVAAKKFSMSEREGGKAAFVVGLCFISEGAIPYAARDPMRVLPCCILGGAVTGALSMAVGAHLMASYGGLFVLLTPVLGYLFAILAGTAVAGLLYAVLKRPDEQLVKAA